MTTQQIATQESERLRRHLAKLLNDGYVIWHFWNDAPNQDDQVVQLGLLTMIKWKNNIARSSPTKNNS